MSESTFQSEESLGSILRAVVSAGKKVARSEVDLVKAEIKGSAGHIQRAAIQAGLFGSLVLIAVVPFLAFAIIALGEWFGDRYWLSSMLVAFCSAVVAGPIAFKLYQKLTAEDEEPLLQQGVHS